MSLISRKLLTPDEISRIENPYILLIIAGKQPALLNVPDISKMHFNILNGMGNKQHNQELRIKREKDREIRQLNPIKIWNLWDQCKIESESYKDINTIRHNFRIMRGKENNDNKDRED